MYLHRTLSDFLLAQEDSSRTIVPEWEDGSDIDVDSDTVSDSDSPGSSSGQQWGARIQRTEGMRSGHQGGKKTLYFVGVSI